MARGSEEDEEGRELDYYPLSEGLLSKSRHHGGDDDDEAAVTGEAEVDMEEGDDEPHSPLLSDDAEAAVPLTSSSPTTRHGQDQGHDYDQDPTSERTLDADTHPETSTLGRNLTPIGSYMLVISTVLGSGIFVNPGNITHSVGSAGLSMSLWLFGALISACSLAISLEFGTMLPRSGGDKVYLEFTYRRPRFLVSTLVATQALLLSFTASNAVIFGQYVAFALGVEEDVLWVRKMIGVLLLVGISVLHGRWLRAGIWVQNLVGGVKLGFMGTMALAGLWVVAFGGKTDGDGETPSKSGEGGGAGAIIPSPGWTIFSWSNLWAETSWSWGNISTALIKVFYSYGGLDSTNRVLNEVQDPVRTLKRVGPAALITVTTLYMLVNVAYFLVIPVQKIKSSGELVAALFFERVFGRTIGRGVLPWAIAVSAAGNVMVNVFGQARVNQEIARQGFLPYSRLLSSSMPYGTPLGGILVLAIPSILILTLVPQGDIYAFIIDVEGYPAQIGALAIAIGLVILRVRRPALKRPFRAPLVAVWVRVLLCVGMVCAPFVSPPPLKGGEGRGDVSFWYGTYAVVGWGVVFIGVAYWWIAFVWFPKRGGYRIEEEFEVLGDGTSVTKLVRVGEREIG